MGSDENHYNVLLLVRDKVTGHNFCSQTTTFEEKGEPKRIRTEVLLLTNLAPYPLAKPAHNLVCKAAEKRCPEEEGKKEDRLTTIWSAWQLINVVLKKRKKEKQKQDRFTTI